MTMTKKGYKKKSKINKEDYLRKKKIKKKNIQKIRVGICPKKTNKN